MIRLKFILPTLLLVLAYFSRGCSSTETEVAAVTLAEEELGVLESEDTASTLSNDRSSLSSSSDSASTGTTPAIKPEKSTNKSNNWGLHNSSAPHSHTHTHNQNDHIPFIPEKKVSPTPQADADTTTSNPTILASIPEAFEINTHIISNPQTHKSFFSDTPSSKIPFLECDHGITTAHIPLRSFSLRHLPPHGASPSWIASEKYKPQLVVCLCEMQITTSGGETRKFKPGNVILVEDEDSSNKGHWMSAVEGGDYESGEEDLSVLILTLNPLPKTVTAGSPNGARKLFENFTHKKVPCDTKTNIPITAPQLITIDEKFPLKRMILSTLGFGISSAITWFLGNVAPHVLAVGVGGVCVVVGGTLGIVKCGEGILDEAERWNDQRQHVKMTSKDDEDADTDIDPTTSPAKVLEDNETVVSSTM